MTPLQYAIWIAATACIVFLIVAHFRESRTWQRGRDILLVISCGVDSGVFFYTRHYWMGLAYAIPALIQTQALMAARRKPKWK
jgi:hypothetical protein